MDSFNTIAAGQSPIDFLFLPVGIICLNDGCQAYQCDKYYYKQFFIDFI
jgi:hypothetical protein